MANGMYLPPPSRLVGDQKFYKKIFWEGSENFDFGGVGVLLWEEVNFSRGESENFLGNLKFARNWGGGGGGG